MLQSDLRCRVVPPQDDLSDVRHALSVLPGHSTHLAASDGFLEGVLIAGNDLFPGVRWYLLHDERGPAAVVPLQWVRESGGAVPAVALHSLSRFELLYADARLRPGVDPLAVGRAIFTSTLGGEPRPDVLRLRDLPEDSGLYAIARTCTREWNVHARPGTSLLPGGSNAAAWEASLSKNLRGHIRQAAKRLSARGEPEVRSAKTPEAVMAAFQRFLELEATGYKGALNALAHEAGDRALMQHALLHHATVGEALVMELWLGATLAASQFGIIRGDRLYLIKVAYNESVAEASPGAFLMAELLRQLSDDPRLAVVDCCVRQKWHDRWHPHVEVRYHITVTSQYTWRGLFLGALRWARSVRS